MSSAYHNFWRQKSWSSTLSECFHIFSTIQLLWKPKITYLNMTSPLHWYDNIFRFQIPINDVFIMKIIKGHYNFSYVKIHMVFDHLILFCHLIIQSTTRDVFHLHINIVFILKITIMTYYKRTYLSIVRFKCFNFRN